MVSACFYLPHTCVDPHSAAGHKIRASWSKVLVKILYDTLVGPICDTLVRVILWSVWHYGSRLHDIRSRAIVKTRFSQIVENNGTDISKLVCTCAQIPVCPPPVFSVSAMGARRNFSRGGQNRRHFKKSTRFRRAVQKNRPFFGAPKAQTKIFAFFRDVLN